MCVIFHMNKGLQDLVLVYSHIFVKQIFRNPSLRLHHIGTFHVTPDLFGQNCNMCLHYLGTILGEKKGISVLSGQHVPLKILINQKSCFVSELPV